jgi:tetratricopeptide (TPR) repeat protein
VLFALHRYFAWTVPFPCRTEVSYWSISARPETAGGRRLFTVAINVLETLFVFGPVDDPSIVDFHLNVDLDVLLARWGSLAAVMQQQCGLVASGAAIYRSRPAVARLWVSSAHDFVRMFTIDGVVDAARRLNLDLMRKGAALNWKSHSLDLADLILEPEPERPALPSGDSTALGKAGAAYDGQGRFDLAETAYRQALTADPTNAQAAFGLANLLDERGDIQSADTLYRQAAASGDQFAAFAVGYLCQQRGDLAGPRSGTAPPPTPETRSR